MSERKWLSVCLAACVACVVCGLWQVTAAVALVLGALTMLRLASAARMSESQGQALVMRSMAWAGPAVLGVWAALRAALWVAGA